MPAQSTRDTLLRSLELLKRLPEHGSGKTAQELTEELNNAGYGVNLRTVQRNLELLATAFPILCNNRSKPYGWRWENAAGYTLKDLSIEDALTLKLLEQHLCGQLPSAITASLQPRFVQATLKLDAISRDNKVARWVNKVRQVVPDVVLQAPKIDPDVWRTVQECLLKEEILEIVYQKADEEPGAPRKVKPLGLVFRGAVSYLVANALPQDERRTFAIHRIISAKRIHESFMPSAHFDLQGEIQSGRLLSHSEVESFQIELWVEKDLGAILVETPLSTDQTLVWNEDQEGYNLTATVQNSWPLWRWLLGQGTSLMVLAPQELQDNIYAEISMLAQWYGITPTRPEEEPS